MGVAVVIKVLSLARGKYWSQQGAPHLVCVLNFPHISMAPGLDRSFPHVLACCMCTSILSKFADQTSAIAYEHKRRILHNRLCAALTLLSMNDFDASVQSGDVDCH